MARILIDGKWFEQVEPSTFSETELEARVILHAPSIYPEYYVLPFKQTVESEYGRAIPDLVFVAKNYREWKIVEIEMGYHNLNGHVEPQVQKLAAADYGVREATYLYKSNRLLDLDKTKNLLRKTEPQVLVIVNQSKEDWVKPLVKYGAILAIFELFRSDDDIEIFRVNGEYPTQIIDTISQCAFHPITPQFLEVQTPNNLNLPRRGRVKLRYNNCMTEWERVDAEGKVWLSPVGRNPLNDRHSYEIFRQSDTSLVLRKRNV
ncbi:MAG: hypothetical protein J5I90_05695 [Caldilineales bacterium]|nr:hypothetical protein [Caldilineales bacterium]